MLSILSRWRAPKPPADLRWAVYKHLVTLRRYHPRHTEKRIAAIRQLADMSLSSAERAEVTSLLLRVLTGQARESAFAAISRAAGRCFQVGAVIGACISIAGLLSSPPIFHLPPEKHFGDAISALALVSFVLLGPVAAPFNAWRSRRANDRVRAACAPVLGRLGDRRALIPLANACRERSRVLRKGAADGLAVLLPGLARAGEEPLAREESIALARSLQALDRDTIVSALSVLEEIGSPAALEPLKVIEYEWAYGHRGDSPDIPPRIRRAITRLEARREEALKRDTLLRPAAGEPHLLRVPISPAGTDPAQLLRSSEGAE